MFTSTPQAWLLHLFCSLVAIKTNNPTFVAAPIDNFYMKMKYPSVEVDVLWLSYDSGSLWTKSWVPRQNTHDWRTAHWEVHLLMAQTSTIPWRYLRTQHKLLHNIARQTALSKLYLHVRVCAYVSLEARQDAHSCTVSACLWSKTHMQAKWCWSERTSFSCSRAPGVREVVVVGGGGRNVLVRQAANYRHTHTQQNKLLSWAVFLSVKTCAA